MSTQIVLAAKHQTSESTISNEASDSIALHVASQKEYFHSEVTKSIDFRIQQLRRLKKLIRQYEDDLLEALHKDLGRSHMESYMSEFMLVINEINYSIKKLKNWAKPKFVDNNFFLKPAKSKIYFEPFGICLILSPWNFPVLLSIRPIISALSAGNCVTLKCSEATPHVNDIMKTMINEHFPQEYFYAMDCGPTKTMTLAQSGFDFIFYTGNVEFGKSIMETAAQTLTPVVLELGGKSPVIVDETADLSLAAKRIVWGKFINSGQSCVAPDYICVHVSRKQDLVRAIEKQIVKLYTKDAINNPDYCKIINLNHFERLVNLLSDAKIICGGNHDQENLKIEPTIVEIESFHDKIMENEIFGPILPIITYKDLDILLTNLRKLPKPLSLYHFSKNKTSIAKVNSTLSFGGGCVNDCMMHTTNKFLPFGGVGHSGFGSYVGEHGFKTFSHAKSIVQRKRFMLFDFLPVFPAYTESKYRIFKIMARLLGY